MYAFLGASSPISGARHAAYTRKGIMFVKALEIVGGYTRPVFTIARRYNSSDIEPASATIFFVNDQGWAITTKHIAQMILESARVESEYNAFRRDKADISPEANFDDEMKVLETRYGFREDKIAQMKVNFFDCVDNLTGFEVKISLKYDLAAIHLDGYNNTIYKGHAIFAKDFDMARPGKFLCRVGYPFAEFQNFSYDPEQDDILWNGNGHKHSSRFPADGMMSRLVASPEGIVGIELNSPGMLGLNGAPLFDETGLVYGMQVGMNKAGLTQCMHAGIIRSFLEKENIPYQVATREEMLEMEKKSPLVFDEIEL